MDSGLTVRAENEKTGLIARLEAACQRARPVLRWFFPGEFYIGMQRLIFVIITCERWEHVFSRSDHGTESVLVR